VPAGIKLVRDASLTPAAHFERSDITILCETVHEHLSGYGEHQIS
jgi:hypothetical protein